jgi:hypothetical protein
MPLNKRYKERQQMKIFRGNICQKFSFMYYDKYMYLCFQKLYRLHHVVYIVFNYLCYNRQHNNVQLILLHQYIIHMSIFLCLFNSVQFFFIYVLSQQL